MNEHDDCPLCAVNMPLSLQFQYQDPDDRDRIIMITLSPKTIAALKAIGVDPAKCTFRRIKNGS